ncbi:MAG: hypothetical protein AB2792_19940 [Candidatus Thiodiazotropha sp.]
MKIVINNCFGGFTLSPKAESEYAKLAGFEIHRYVQTKYKHRDGHDLYEKTDSLNNSNLTYTFKKDCGPSFTDFPEDGGYWYSSNVERDDPLLIQVVEKLGKEASGLCAKLKIVEIPDGVDWEIDEYDGNEHVAECHRTWY